MHVSRVFIVEDSLVYRTILMEVINTIPGVRVIGSAQNGKDAIITIPQLHPDVITLDMQMPLMDGLQTLYRLHDVYPDFRAIIISSHTRKGAADTIRALEAGAFDFVTKPDSGDDQEHRAYLRSKLTPLLTGPHFQQSTRSDALVSPASERNLSSYRCFTTPGIIAIGISTGGPSALAVLLSSLPADFPVPIIIVQHMPQFFTKSLADSLDKKVSLHVTEAQDDQIIVSGTAYIAPGGKQMKVIRGKDNSIRIKTTDDPPENFCKPSADYLFRSVAEVYQNQAVGIIMTGLGSDGTRGLQCMKNSGALIIAQDQKTSTVWSMPREAISTGIVDIVLPLEDIGSHINGIIHNC